MKNLHLAAVILSVSVGIALVFLFGANLLDTAKPGTVSRLTDLYRIWNLYNPTHPQGDDNGITAVGFDWIDSNWAVFVFGNADPPGASLWKISKDGKDISRIQLPMQFDVIDKVHAFQDRVYFDGWYDRQNKRDVFEVSLDNGTFVQLTHSGEINMYDVLPDGKIVFEESHSYKTEVCPLYANDTSGSNWAGYYTTLWLADANGRKIKAIYNGTEVFRDMVTSTDGKSIAFTDITDPSHPMLHAMISCTSFPGPIEPNLQYGLKLLNLDDGQISDLGSSQYDFYNPKWTPDGKFLLYVVTPHKCLTDAANPNEQHCISGFLKMLDVSDGSSQLVYGRNGPPYSAAPMGADPSPDGKSVIFSVLGNVNDGLVNGAGIYILNLDRPLA
ncbi:MAG: PD40 domain-containing protein [Thaumarchaeota archaeon]|nr:PD40 domain-containing protein [Nitrososphaerota archaeon]